MEPFGTKIRNNVNAKKVMGLSMVKDAINVRQKTVIFAKMLSFLNVYNVQKDLLKAFQKQKFNVYAHCPLPKTQTMNVNVLLVLAGIIQHKIVNHVLLLIVINVAGIIRNVHLAWNLLSYLLKENVLVLLVKDSMLLMDAPLV